MATETRPTNALAVGGDVGLGWVLRHIAATVDVDLDAAAAALAIARAWDAGLDDVTALDQALTGGCGELPAASRDALHAAWSRLAASSGAAA